MAYYDVQIEPVLQEIKGEVLTPYTNSSRCSARHSHSFRSGMALPFLTLVFDAQMRSLINVWHHKTNLTLTWELEEENECQQGARSRTRLFYTAGVYYHRMNGRWMQEVYHNRLAELLPTKKGEDYSTTVSWIRDKVSFAFLTSALLCLRGSRCKRRASSAEHYR